MHHSRSDDSHAGDGDKMVIMAVRMCPSVRGTKDKLVE